MTTIFDQDGDKWFRGDSGLWHLSPGSPGITWDQLKENYGPLYSTSGSELTSEPGPRSESAKPESKTAFGEIYLLRQEITSLKNVIKSLENYNTRLKSDYNDLRTDYQRVQTNYAELVDEHMLLEEDLQAAEDEVSVLTYKLGEILDILVDVEK